MNGIGSKTNSSLKLQTSNSFSYLDRLSSAGVRLYFNE